MQNKTTKQLEEILLKTHLNEIDSFLKTERTELFDYTDFSAFMHETAAKHNLRFTEVFIRAGISDGYGYKIISGEKHTLQRDLIIRLCYGAKMNLEETQRALKLYGFAPLYARIPRDAYLIAGISEKFISIYDLNDYLIANGQQPLLDN